MDTVPDAREEGFYWVFFGQNPPENAYRKPDDWWLWDENRLWQPDAVTVASDRLTHRPPPAPAA